MNLIQCKVNFNYMVQLSHIMYYLSIIDGGADTHVLGAIWIKKITVNKHTPMVDVIGFDSQAARKHNLPIGPHAIKISDSNGREIILMAKHGVGNTSSKHTLLCSYQMREMGIIVDDVHTKHAKDITGTLGSQSITFQDGTIVNLKCKSTLMAFNTSIPTMDEINSLPTYQIAFENWDPQRYYDDADMDKIAISNLQEKNNTKATLFLSNASSPPENNNMETSISELSLDDTNSLIPMWDTQTSHSAISSLPSLNSEH